MSNVMLVGGTFDRTGGKSSYFVSEIAKNLHCELINGGELEVVNNFDPSPYRALIWMPNIDNAEDKIIPALKKKNPTMLLVCSKRVIEKKRSNFELIGRMLGNHANLMIRIDKRVGVYKFSLLDPLGNVYVSDDSLEVLAKELKSRITFLLSLSRLRSISMGEKNILQGDSEFIQVVKSYADKFTELIEAIHPERFLGNASFRPRCSYGFPSIRYDDNLILVSRRNVDKQIMSINEFVLARLSDDKKIIEYHGQNKPSVDTPVQVKLYERYPNINYMIHGHVYIENAPFTEHKIPCGYVEEYDDVIDLVPNNANNFVINLRGHGCLIAGSDLKIFQGLKLKARKIFELQ